MIHWQKVVSRLPELYNATKLGVFFFFVLGPNARAQVFEAHIFSSLLFVFQPFCEKQQ